MPDFPTIWAVGLGFLAVIVILLIIVGNRWVKVGPNEVLIVSGRKQKVRGADGKAMELGFRLVRGGGTFVWPVVEMAEVMSLELITLDVRTHRSIYFTWGTYSS